MGFWFTEISISSAVSFFLSLSLQSYIHFIQWNEYLLLSVCTVYLSGFLSHFYLLMLKVSKCPFHANTLKFTLNRPKLRNMLNAVSLLRCASSKSGLTPSHSLLYLLYSSFSSSPAVDTNQVLHRSCQGSTSSGWRPGQVRVRVRQRLMRESTCVTRSTSFDDLHPHSVTWFLMCCDAFTGLWSSQCNAFHRFLSMQLTA